MAKLQELPPEDLLDFLKRIREPDDIRIITINCDRINRGVKTAQGYIPFDLVINNLEWTAWVNQEAYYTTSCYFWRNSSPTALKEVRHDFAKQLGDWLSVYVEWVENDTGYKMSDDFFKELTDEVERILNLFE